MIFKRKYINKRFFWGSEYVILSCRFKISKLYVDFMTIMLLDSWFNSLSLTYLDQLFVLAISKDPQE